MLFYCAIFLILLFLFFASESIKRSKIVFLIVSAIILCCTAAFRSKGVDSDYGGYVMLYDNTMPINYYIDNSEDLVRQDPAFTIISSIVKYSLNDKVILLFVFFATMGVFLKVLAIKRLSSFWLLSVLIYFSNYFILHEMTQIRIGVATGFLLLSIPSIKNRELVKFIAFVILAALFHYSCLIFLPLYLINPKKINIKQYLIIMITPILFQFANLSIHKIFYVLGENNPLTKRYFIYTNLLSQGIGEKTNTFNILILFNITIGFILIMKWKRLYEKNPYAVVLIKVYIFSIVLFYLFYDVGAFAFRFFEILNVVQIIVLPFFIHLFRPRHIAVIGVIICAAGLLSLNLFYTKLLSPYFKL